MFSCNVFVNILLAYIFVSSIVLYLIIKKNRKKTEDLITQKNRLGKDNRIYYIAIRRLKWLATGESGGVSAYAELAGNEEGISCDDIEVLRNAIIALPD